MVKQSEMVCYVNFCPRLTSGQDVTKT